MNSDTECQTLVSDATVTSEKVTKKIPVQIQNGIAKVIDATVS